MTTADAATALTAPTEPAAIEVAKMVELNGGNIDAVVEKLFAELVPIVRYLEPVENMNIRRRRLHMLLAEAGIRNTDIAKRTGARADNVRQSLLKARREDPAQAPTTP